MNTKCPECALRQVIGKGKCDDCQMQSDIKKMGAVYKSVKIQKPNRVDENDH